MQGLLRKGVGFVCFVGMDGIVGLPNGVRPFTISVPAERTDGLYLPNFSITLRVIKFCKF